MDEPVRTPQAAEEPPPVAASRPAPPPGSLWRQDVNEAVEDGLGYFLQRVSVEPEVVGGKFQGFRITDLRPVDFWKGVDLKPGDVVQQVNGMPIERDIDAYKAFESLRAAESLRVSFVRAGARRELVFAIVDGAGKAPAPKAAPSPKPPAAAPPPPGGKQDGTG